MSVLFFAKRLNLAKSTLSNNKTKKLGIQARGKPKASKYIKNQKDNFFGQKRPNIYKSALRKVFILDDESYASLSP